MKVEKLVLIVTHEKQSNMNMHQMINSEKTIINEYIFLFDV